MPSSSNQQTLATTCSCEKSVLFRIFPVVLSGPNSSVHTFAFFDDGSSVTLIEEDLANQLEIDGPSNNLCLRWTSNDTRTEVDSKCVSVTISNPKSTKRYPIKGVRTVKSLNLPCQTVDMDEMVSEYPHLSGLPIKSMNEAVPRILIGIDNWNIGIPIQRREGNPEQPFATKTRLGWMVSGPSKIGKAAHSGHFHVCACNEDENIHQLVKNYFALENSGVNKPAKTLISKDDERAMTILETTTSRVEGRFETGLLWRDDQVVFPPSYHMAKRRLECLEAKMSRDSSMKEKMTNLMAEYISKQYVRKLIGSEINDNERSWYLPIFSIKNPNKPDKFRAVWDAAARVDGVSLNDKLLKGPDQLASLVDILFRFRQKKIAFSGDIREMYHQVQVKEEDRNSQRFLWRNDVTDQPDVYRMEVMTFGATCSPASAQYVKNLNAAEHKDRFPDAHDAIITNHYVDDWLQSVDTVEEAVKLIHDVIHVHSSAGFQIRKWMCNSEEVLRHLKSDQTDIRDMSEDDTTKVLGMLWSTRNDQFQYFIDLNRIDEGIVNQTRRPTKRQILRIMMTIYDPLGLISPFLIYVKIILQEVWRSGIDWDDDIEDDQYVKWLRWFEYLPSIAQVRVPRAYEIPANCMNIQLHTFVDGSENAYSAVVYLRAESETEVNVSLVGSKAKVTPLRALSIPRIELEAALLGTRLSMSILQAHSINITSRHYWTDSSTVIRWLQSDHRRYKQFVAHRVSEILESTEVSEWSWLSTKDNVADEATKWKPAPNLQPDSRWLKGPYFLYRHISTWPKCLTKDLPPADDELRVQQVHIHHIINDAESTELLPKFDNFSKWSCLKRAQAYVFRAAYNALSKTKGNEKRLDPLSKEEIEAAEWTILRAVQRSAFASEIAAIHANPETPVSKSSSIHSLSPFLDVNGILRHKTRISIEYGAKLGIETQPIILPKKHVVTRLIMLSFHCKYKHQYAETAVNELRQLYVIPRLRTAYKTAVLSCQMCKIKRAKPKVPEMAPLPKPRLGYMLRTFSYTGVDLFGPLEVAIGRRVEKRWGVILTCLTVRAIHIEIVHSLSTDSFIMCFRNFIARRGCPMEVFSDNGTNFHGSDRELKRLEDIAGKEEFSSIKWNFNPPLSPHMGGAWERLVRSIKNTLREILPTKRPSDEVLRSALMEAEMIINSRPLTYIPTDPDELEALTPNHFLLGSSNGVKSLGAFEEKNACLRNTYRASQHIATLFWRRWLKEYLPTITRRTKWFENVEDIKVGDLVTIHDPNVRNSWKRGVVIDVTPGRDNKVRSAVVKTSSGIYTRPAASIAVLDVEKKDDVN